MLRSYGFILTDQLWEYSKDEIFGCPDVYVFNSPTSDLQALQLGNFVYKVIQIDQLNSGVVIQLQCVKDRDGVSTGIVLHSDIGNLTSTKWRLIWQPKSSKVNIVKETKISGLSCNRCGDFNNYAEVNQQDGTYRCFLCR